VGLDISHDAWHSAYGTFSWWRVELAKVSGIGTKWVDRYPELLSDTAEEYPNVDYESYTEDNFLGKWEKVPNQRTPSTTFSSTRTATVR
jgi:hypothetical protein